VDKRFQVFVSSTFLDLQEERAAVVSALLQLDAIPAGMELFPAADDDAWTLIKRVIDTSDYYLLVIGGKYGSVDPASTLSFTEKEFDLAVELKKPVMAFLHASPDSIPLGKSEADHAARARLQSFRDKVQATKHVKFWASPEDLAGKVALSYAHFQRTYPAVGWIRGDAQASSEALRELNELRKQLRVAEQQVASARTTPPPGTTHLAQGDDLISFTLGTQIDAKIPGDKYLKTWTGTLRVEVTWNDLFWAVGPGLLDESNQYRMHLAINSFLTDRFAERARDAVRTAAGRKNTTVERFGKVEIALGPDDFATVLIQLRALGLVHQSQKKRSVSDTSAYWTLTPYGDEHLTTLRAISRADAPNEDDTHDDVTSP
jgi:hypothetical protein